MSLTEPEKIAFMSELKEKGYTCWDCCHLKVINGKRGCTQFYNSYPRVCENFEKTEAGTDVIVALEEAYE